jgi:hypothetical protein
MSESKIAYNKQIAATLFNNTDPLNLDRIPKELENLRKAGYSVDEGKALLKAVIEKARQGRLSRDLLEKYYGDKGKNKFDIREATFKAGISITETTGLSWEDLEARYIDCLKTYHEKITKEKLENIP